jgi:uncharacterized protein
MVESTFLLFQIQKIDTEIRQNESRLREFTTNLNNDSIFLQADQVYQTLLGLLSAVEKQSSDIDKKIADFKNKKQQLNSSLYGGKIQNSKELQDLQKEIESIGKNISLLEDLQIQKWEEIEKLRAEKDIQESKLLLIKETRHSQVAGIQSAIELINNEIGRLKIEKKGIRDQIAKSLLELYDTLIITKKGVAITQIDESYCSSCGNTLTPSDCQNAKVHSSITYCSNCGRILYGD